MTVTSRLVAGWLLGLTFFVGFPPATEAQTDAATGEYVLGPADVIHITVFQNPDLTTDARVSETGTITFPLIGAVSVVGSTIAEAETAIARKLSDGHYVAKAQVTVLPTLIRGSQVTVLGYVNHPGRYPLETVNTHVSDVLSTAGGIAASGADTVFVIQHRDGQTIRKELDVDELFVKGSEQDEQVHSGDTIYLPREPEFYIYGEVRSPGAYRLQRHMTVMQALAVGGGDTRTSKYRFQAYRQDEQGAMHEIELKLVDMLEPNDVIYVPERLF
jgi:polysaccharide export outer membrane protein